jgi:hypothetical protein
MAALLAVLDNEGLQLQPAPQGGKQLAVGVFTLLAEKLVC